MPRAATLPDDPDAQEVAAAVTTGLVEELGPRLLGLYVHGSFVAGDFLPERSDLDLLAVLDRDPDDALIGALQPVLAAVEHDHPYWAGRVEVEHVSTAALACGASGADLGMHSIARVSPEEALHLLPATSHRLLTWASVRDSGLVLSGPPATDLLPPIDPALLRSALLDHVRDRPTWVRAMHDAGGQAYAVLTMCRALVRLTDGIQLSKRGAADRALDLVPQDSGLIRWASTWWYAGGADDAPPRSAEVVDFVDRTCAGLLSPEA